MTSRSRWPARLALLAVLLVGLLAMLHTIALRIADNALTTRGFVWNQRTTAPLSATWHGLHRPGLQIDRLTVRPTAAHILGAEIDLAAISRAGGGTSTVSGGESRLPLTAEGITLRWNDQILAEGLAGSVRPTLQLTGPDCRVEQSASGLKIALQRETPLGEGLLTVEGNEQIVARLEVPAARLSHPLLSKRPLPPSPLVVDAVWARSASRVDGQVTLGAISARFFGTVSVNPLHFALTIEAPEIALHDLVALFGDQIREARTAKIRGHFSVTAKVEGPPVKWSATLGAEGLAAEDVILNPDRLIAGRLRGWEGTWTPRVRAEMLSAAIVAAEDAAFWRHRGVDLDGINVALAEVAEGVERPRGGSTLTQQLAKNLYLDGERTIARKLRELLYALELERRLSKARILELYLNIVEFGPDIIGAHAASEVYFVKRPEDLMPHEAALLAAVLPSPRKWYGRLRRGQQPSDAIARIVRNMADTGAITPEVARWAVRQRPTVVP